MTTSGSHLRPVWLLPIVLAICAVMVLPGGAALSAAASPGNPLAAAVGVNPSTVAPVPSAAPTNAEIPNPAELEGSGTSAGAAAALTGLSPTYATAPWVQMLQAGTMTHPLTSLPNLAILKGETSVSTIIPAFTNPPAPLGIADYGLGAQTYSYNTSHILGQVVFNTPPNATNPGATDLIMPNNPGQHQGYIGSPYTFGIQLNTIATNITVPGSNSGFFWTQNVVNWNDTGIHFVDDTFNASGGYIGSGVIVSACNNNSAGVDLILAEYGGVFQCVGKTIPISAASYPITLQLYNNATTNSEGQSVVSYGYNIIEAGTHLRQTGISDSVVFNNTAGGTPPTTPGFTIDGFDTTPGGFYRDAEIVLVGGIGGDNADFRSVNGTINLEYSNLTAGGFQNVPSGYNWGDDTGESSIGIADYWTPSHALVMNQGPAMLYGLWGAEPQVAVPSGDIHLSGSIDPSFGFVFVGNQAPGGYGQNLSWVPTDNSGDFNTYLPPLGAPWTSAYYVQAWADGYDELNGTPVTGSVTGYSLALVANIDNDQAPLYMYGDAQASALAAAVGSPATPPYDFYGLEPFVNVTFDRVNDYTYPTFALFQAIGVTGAINVSGISQGPSSEEYGWLYWYPEPYPPATGLLTPAGELLADPEFEQFSSQIAFLDDQGVDNVSYQVLIGSGFHGEYAPAGGSIEFWQETNAVVYYALALDFSQGIWVGDSTGTTLSYVIAGEESTGVTDLGSSHTTVWTLSVDDSLGVESATSVDSTYSWVNVTDYGAGFEVGYDAGYIGSSSLAYYSIPGTTGMTINELNVTEDSLGANITLSKDTTFNDVGAYDPDDNSALAIELDATLGTTISDTWVYDAGAISAWNATDTTVTGLTSTGWYEDGAAEVYVLDSTGLTLTDITILYPWDFGVLGDDVNNVVVSDADIEDAYGGVVFGGGSGFSATDLYDGGNEFGFELDYETGAISFSDAAVIDDYIGINLYYTSGATVTDVVVSDSQDECINDLYCGGIASYDTTGNSFSWITSTDESLGVRLDYGTSSSTFTTVNVTEASLGVEIDASNHTRITDVNASGDDSLGVEMDEGSVGLTIDGLVALEGAAGLVVEDSATVSVTDVLADGDAHGVFASDSTGVSVSTVTAELDSTGVEATDTPGTSVADVSADNSGTYGVEFVDSPGGSIATVAAGDYAYGVYLTDSPHTTVSGVSAADGAIGLVIDPSIGVTISGVSASDQAIGVEIDGSSWDNVSDVSATGLSVGVEILPLDDEYYWPSTHLQISGVTVSDLSIGVWVYESGEIDITGVTATNATTSMPWGFYSDAWGGTPPIAAVYTEETYQLQISNVAVSNYPIGLYDAGSGDGYYPGSIYLQGLTSTADFYGVVLNFTEYAYLNGVSSSHDWLGVWEVDTYENDLLGSSFIDDTSYGVSLWDSEYNYVWGSTFIGDNGATDTYSAAHIQAYSGYGCGDCYNSFNSPVEPYTGNYWADWHSWNTEGTLNPYYVGDQNWDYYPLYAPANETAVWFYEDGLTAGTTWSVTFDGATQSSANAWMVFAATSGTYAYTVGAVPGFTASPSSGSVATGTTGDVAVELAFSPATTVTLTETGLPAGTAWNAVFGGIAGNSTGSTIQFASGVGTFSYQVGAVAGYTASPSSGTVTVTASGYAILIAFTQVTYAVTISASGLAPGVTWSATVNGVTQSTSGASLTWYVPNGTYAYSVSAPSGYTVSGGTGNVVVNGAPGNLGAAFASSSTTSFVTSSTFNTWLIVALVIAVIALVLALLAVLTRRRGESPPPAAPWTGPTPTTEGGAPEGHSSAPAQWDEQSESTASPPPAP